VLGKRSRFLISEGTKSLGSQQGLRDMYQDDTFFSRIRKKIAYHFIKEDGVIITRCLAAGAEHQKRLHES
jgi:hypothetical protein